jgi:hypothetical protein
VLVLYANGEVRLTDSTVSGNSASTGGGVSFGTTDDSPPLGATGSAAVDNSTIASNTASAHGGGIFLASYTSPADHVTITSPTVQVTSSLVGDNTANGAAEDADRGDNSTGGGLDLAFGLIEAPGDAPTLTSADRPSILGQDPKLGALADNGGVTKTQAPALDSPAIDKGFAPARPGIDQRGQNRTVDGSGVDNAPRGDIGALELQNPPVKPPDVPPPPANVGPTSAITKNALGAKKAKKRVLRGTAADADGTVAKVEVAIVRKKNGKCSSLKASGRFSKPASCANDPVFLAASGTAKWSFRPAKKLPHGNYVVFSRATDDDGAVQESFPARSVDPFRIG